MIMNNVLKFGAFVGLLIMNSCRPDSFVVDFSMILDTYEMSIYEPSGLSYSPDKSSLYTVSDRGMIYEMSLTGKTIRELPFTGDDFEAIAVDPESAEIYICEERNGDILRLNNEGILQETYNILDTPGNTGLEGITLTGNPNEVFLLKEKSEGLLIKYALENDTKTQIRLNFAYDYSGIYLNQATNNLWIISEESKKLFMCTPEGTALKTYPLPISGMEGIVVNDQETEAYIVSDTNKKLYRIDLTYDGYLID